MIGTLTSNIGIVTNQVARTNDVKKSENIQNVEDKKEGKASKIAEAIANGTYKVDITKTTSAIADTLL
jgi:hypothetical protein